MSLGHLLLTIEKANASPRPFWEGDTIGHELGSSAIASTRHV